MTAADRDNRRIGALFRAAVIVLATAWVYGPAFRGNWLWDDGLEVSQNPALRDPAGWWKPWAGGTGMDYFPLKDTLRWIHWHLWAGNVLGYHLVNVGLHALGALLAWRLLALLGLRAAWIGGLIFAVHPLAVESVAWISEFKNTLSLPLLLAAAIAYVKSRKFEQEGREDREGTAIAGPIVSAGLYWLSVALFVLALLSKVSVAMFPVMILLHAWWRQGRIGRRDVRVAIPYFIASLALGGVAVWYQLHRAIGIAGTPAGFASRVAESGWSVALYTRDCLFPFWLTPIASPVGHPIVGGLLWLAVLLVLEFCWSRRAGYGRHALLGFGWFLVNLLPVLGLIPMAYLRVGPRADHLAYLSLLGLVGLGAAAIGAAYEELAGSEGWTTLPRAVFNASLLVLAAALAWQARFYAGIYRSEAALWSYAVRANPEAWLARNNLGKVLLDSGRPGDAVVQLREAVSREPDSAEAHANLGNALWQSGLPAMARSELEAALRINPAFAGAHYDLGLLLMQSGLAADAAGQFREALRDGPGSAPAHNNLGLALSRLGLDAAAVAEYRRALELDPGLPEAHLNLGNALFRGARVDDAVAEYRAAIRGNPLYAAAHHNLGHALAELGLYREARSEIDEAERLESARGGAQPQ